MPGPKTNRYQFVSILILVSTFSVFSSWAAEKESAGALGTQIPIRLPPGRADIVPKLLLRYSSTQQNSWLGVGWELEIGAVRRSLKKGVDYAGDNFVVVADGATAELVRRDDWGADHYGARIEGAFTQYRFNSETGGWEAIARNGVICYYGSSPDSRQENLHGVFKWCLDRVEDPNGNFMAAVYTKDRGQIYLQRIDYTGNGALEPSNQVKFYLQQWPDTTVVNATRSAVTTAYRLKTIDVQAAGYRVGAYRLDYENSAATSRSLLIGLQQFGSDAQLDASATIVSGTALPATTFGWSKESDGTIGAVSETANDGSDHDRLTGDFNGDGRMDLFYPGVSNEPGRQGYGNGAYVRLSVKNGGFSPVMPISSLNGKIDRPPMIGDFNGDGKADLLFLNLQELEMNLPHSWRWLFKWIFSQTSETVIKVSLSNGDGTFTEAIECNDCDFDIDPKTDPVIGDFNGDGKTDLAIADGRDLGVGLSNGDGTFAPVMWTSSWPWIPLDKLMTGDFNGDGMTDLLIGPNDSTVKLSSGDGTFGPAISTGESGWPRKIGDFNGDGLADLFLVSGSNIGVRLSNGNDGFGPVIETPAAEISDHTDLMSGDFNGDGRLDVSHADSNGFNIRFANGDGSFAPLVTTQHSYDQSGVPKTGDFNGDGVTDFCTVDPSLISVIYANGSQVLLNRISSGSGASTVIEYSHSSDYQNTLLPFVVPTIAAITQDDGLGNLSTTTYHYKGGLYDTAEREFAGFNYVKQTRPDGTSVETWFHQDPAFRNRPYLIETRMPNEGPLMTRTTLLWEKALSNDPGQNDPGPGSTFVKLSQKRTESYDDQVVFSQHDTIYDDQNGHLLTLTVSGTDAETITRSYHYQNYGNWLWRLVRQTTEGSLSGRVRQTTYQYEPLTGNLMSRQDRLEADTDPSTDMTYDDYGNLKTITDPRGYTTAVDYDTVTYTYPVRIAYPETGGVSHITEIEEYDYRFGKAQRTRDENGNRTHTIYDPFGRVVQIDFPDGGQVSTEYRDNAYPRYRLTTKKANPSAEAIDKYEYFDGWGRNIQTITFGEDGRPVVTRKHYDEMSRASRIEGPFFGADTAYPQSPPSNTPWIETFYDYRGRPIWIESPHVSKGFAASAISYSGLSMAVTDPDQAGTTRKSDYLGRIIQVTEHAGGGEPYNTAYAYDAAGNLESITDQFGNVTAITYDTLGRKTAMNDPDMGRWSYEYDANGNMITQTDARGQTVTFAYDELNRVTAKRFVASGAEVAYTYDDLSIPNGRGRIFRMENADTVIEYGGYDPMGRVTAVRRKITGDDVVRETGYAYDLSGKPTRISYPDGYVVDYTYYPGTGLLHTVTGSDGVQYARLSQYEATGNIGLLIHENGTSTRTTYDPLSTRILSIVTQGHGGLPENDIQRKDYHYTSRGDIQQVHDHLQDIVYSYRYDKLHRLIAETNTGGTDPVAYEYGATGGILSRSIGTARFDYTYDSAHTHAVGAILANAEVYRYSYDENGNMTGGPDFSDPSRVGTRSITYNGENMPTWIETVKKGQSVTTGLAYDANGDRVKKAVSGGITTYYFGKYFKIVEGVAVRYVFAGDLRLASQTESAVTYYHKDHLGSTAAMTDENGAIIETTRYMPFGGAREHDDLEISTHNFTDQEPDPETGLYNYNARLYDPMIGRFISADTLVAQPYDPQSLDRYSYCRNNPLILVDPSGHQYSYGYNNAYGVNNQYGNSAGQASTTNTSTGYIENNYQWVDYNWGTINNNFNTVYTNNGVVINNYGTVNINNNVVEANYGNIYTNNGVVYTNYDSGVIWQNNGNVNQNFGMIFSNNVMGIVGTNHGSVQWNAGTVNANYGHVNQSSGVVYWDAAESMVIAQNRFAHTTFDYNAFKDVIRGAEFGFRAAGLVSWEVGKMATRNVAMAALNYIPLPPVAGFVFGLSINSIGVAANVAKFGNMAVGISGRIQDIHHDVFPRL